MIKRHCLRKLQVGCYDYVKRSSCPDSFTKLLNAAHMLKCHNDSFKTNNLFCCKLDTRTIFVSRFRKEIKLTVLKGHYQKFLWRNGTRFLPCSRPPKSVLTLLLYFLFAQPRLIIIFYGNKNIINYDHLIWSIYFIIKNVVDLPIYIP